MKQVLLNLFRQKWLRYSLVGGLSSFVLFSVSNLLQLAGLNEQLCFVIGWLATLPISFFGQRYFTFDPKTKLHRLYLLFYLIAMLLILAVNQITTWYLLQIGLPFVVVSLGVVLTVTMAGYNLFRFWVFRPIGSNQTQEGQVN